MERRTWKRENPNHPTSLAKRLRLPPAAKGEAADLPDMGRSSSSRSAVMVTGLPSDCTVLELKSRLEMYGPISRIRIEVNSSGYVTFRSELAAEAAIAASLDPAFGISIGSTKIEVVRASDPVTHWRIGIGASATSKLVPAEKPPSRHGKSKTQIIPGTVLTKNRPELSHTVREIRVYDDLF